MLPHNFANGFCVNNEAYFGNYKLHMFTIRQLCSNADELFVACFQYTVNWRDFGQRGDF